MSRGKKNKALDMPTPAQVCFSRELKLFHRREWKRFFWKLVIIAVIVWAVFAYVFGIFFVEGQSMYPTLRDGDITFVYRINKEYHIGDVVSYQYTEKDDTARYFGRIVAVAGDVVDMSDEGDLLLNGNIQPEEVLYPTYKTDAKTKFPYTVPEGEVFLLGDMRTSSTDSRDFGSIPLIKIEGVVFTVITRRGI